MDSVSRRGMGRPGGVLFIALLLGMCLAGAAAAQNVGRVFTPVLHPQARLQPADLADDDGFGSKGALSADGRTAVLPAPYQDCAAGRDCGAVYVFALDRGMWTQQTKLTLPGAAADDQTSPVVLSADGDVVLIGSYSRDCELGPDCGAAYIFERSDGVWSSGVKLDSPRPQSFAHYGGAVGLSGAGDVAVVGALLQSCPSPPGGPNCGAAYVFRRTGGTWSLETTLHSDLLSDNTFGAVLFVSNDGTMVVVDGDFYFGVGTGASYVFHETGGIWRREAKIVPPGNRSEPVALSGDGQTLAIVQIPSWFFDPRSYSIYVRKAGVWTQQDPVFSSQVGGAIEGLSFDGNTAIILNGGKVQFFGRSGDTWSLLQELIPAEPGAAGWATWAALSTNARTTLVGLPRVDCSDLFFCRGAAYIYVAEGFSPDVPTLGELGLALLALLIAGSGALLLLRRRSLHVVG